MLGRIAYLLSPTVLEVFVYFFGAVGAIVVGSYHLILTGFNTDETTNQAPEKLVGEFTDKVLQSFQGGESSALLTTIVFWSIAGLAFAVGVWFLINIFIDMYNNVAISVSFTHNKSFSQSDYWLTFVFRILFQVLVFLVLIVMAIVFIKNIYPFLLEASRGPVGNWASLGGWFQFLLSIVGFMLSMHVTTILLRLLFQRARVFNASPMEM